MGLVASCCAAAACSCCIGLSCSCCGLLVTVSKSVATRVWYTVLFVVLGALAWALSMWAYELLGWIPWPAAEACTEEYCGVVAVYKLTFGMVVFHAALALLLLGVRSSRDVRAQLNDGWWAVKLPLAFFLVLAAFCIPYSFYTYYAWVSVFAAGLFILVQLVLLVDFAYAWNESWVAKWEGGDEFGAEESPGWYYGLLAATVVLFGFALALDALTLTLFSLCWYNVLIVCALAVACAVLTLASLTPAVRRLNPSVGLLQAAVFSAYVTYLGYSAVLSEPDGCLRWELSGSGATHSDWITLIFGGLFTVVSVVYSSLRIGSSDALSTKEAGAATAALLEEAADGSEEAEEELEALDDELQGVRYNYSLFHVSFALGYMYVAMLLTNWSVISGETDSTETDAGWVAVGVKLASAVAAAALYAWTMFAPALLKDREF